MSKNNSRVSSVSYEAIGAQAAELEIEPGVYLKGIGGCRIEDTVILTETGFIDPYTVSKQLIVV